jgi:hypothetical protein
MSQDYESTIDPQLLRQVAQASISRQSVGATFTLRSRTLNASLSPAQTNAIVRKILDRITRQTHCKPKNVSVFPNIQSFAVDAAPIFVEKLLRQPEIVSAVANEQTEDLLIRPVESHEVSLEDAEEPVNRAATLGRRRRR